MKRWLLEPTCYPDSFHKPIFERRSNTQCPAPSPSLSILPTVRFSSHGLLSLIGRSPANTHFH